MTDIRPDSGSAASTPAGTATRPRPPGEVRRPPSTRPLPRRRAKAPFAPWVLMSPALTVLIGMTIAPAVSGLVFRQLLNPNYGWVNYYLGKLGLPAGIDWFANASSAWVAVIGLDVWPWTPFVALILIAGLQSLPRAPVEAAAVDGASRWQTFRYVTLPQLTPFIAIAVVLRTIQAFKTFDTFKILTGGGPGNSTEIINLGIYRVAL